MLSFFFSKQNSIINFLLVFPSRQNVKTSGRNSSRLVIWSRYSFWILIVPVLTLALSISCISPLLANDELLPESSEYQKERQMLQHIQTILVTGSVKTWLDVPGPLYNVGVNLKLKLEDAGFKVVFDPTHSYDANLRIQYEEFPSGQFRVLEQATAIHYRMQLVHAHLGKIFSHQFEARPNDIPVGSLYWDTIGNLEENPYYCFVGDLIRGHIQRGQNEQDMLVEVLIRPYTNQDQVNAAGSRGSTQATVRQRARLNIIQELGQGGFDTPEARKALWIVAKEGVPNERGAALAQLGTFGDSSFLIPLADLLEHEDDPEVRSAGEQAMRQIESR